MIWAITLIVIVLLFIFPKQMRTILAVLLAGISVIALIDYINSSRKEKKQESVSVNVSYAPNSCSKDTPLFFEITNGGTKIVSKVSWNVTATEIGKSINVVDYRSFPSYQGEYSISHHSEYTTPFSTDKKLKPGESISICYGAPLLKSKVPLKSIVWQVSNKYSEFQ